MRYLSPERIARRYAFVSNPIVTLAAYLSKDDYGKALEILTSYPEEFGMWLEENRPWLMEHGYPEFARIDLQLAIERGEWNASTTEVPEEVVLKFWGDIEENFRRYAEAEHPTWLFMRNPKIVKNEWLIHFTRDAHTVACRGFTNGMDDYTRLGLTTRYSLEQKPGGYNFAYSAKGWEHYAQGQHGFKYGGEAVLFRASGVQVWHDGDIEAQVIFVGNTAQDIVPLTQSGYDGGWWANGIGKGGREEGNYEQGDGSFESLSKAVKWVLQNFSQYKRLLTC
jgi:hypothetical protein